MALPVLLDALHGSISKIFFAGCGSFQVKGTQLLLRGDLRDLLAKRFNNGLSRFNVDVRECKNIALNGV